jgi:hypothetical protein
MSVPATMLCPVECCILQAPVVVVEVECGIAIEGPLTYMME